MLVLAMLAIVSVALQNTGGLFFQPTGNTSGNAINGSSSVAVENMTPIV